MYEGVDIEDSRVNNYVDQTSMQVLAYRNSLAQVYYHSTCGGQTEDAGDLWGKSVPYLRSVACRFCESSPYFTWSLRLSRDTVAKFLKKKGCDLVPVSARVKRLTSSRRAETILFSDRRRSLEMKANDFRTLAGTKELKSLLFTVRSSFGGFVFEGHGFGHGSGCASGGQRDERQRHGLSADPAVLFQGTRLMKTPQMEGNR